ncbi:MAG: ABC transporter ATP-binding protein [Roseiflexaceae bacterium]|nr:ABC transporter ATP-binding protein [Roseiflexaceae bacterium]
MLLASGQAVVQIEQVSKLFGTNGTPFQALDSVSCAIQRGEMVAIMGPSGSGKSTLMNIIGLLDVPSSGAYRLDGEDVSMLDRSQQARVRNAKIGFIFQSFNLLPRLTAQANVELPLVYGRVAARERQQRAQAALEAVGLSDKRENLPNQLSGGQKQRVAIARALVTQPSMLLADEPTGALDTKTGAEILGLFRELNRERGVTFVVVTHDAEVGRQMDRVIGLRDGKIMDRILETYYYQDAEHSQAALPALVAA